MPRTGYFILHSNVVPKVTAGRYELVSEQTDTPFPVAPEVTSITVSAPRYVMPTDQILSTFPPANAEGSFGDRLPQIVLKRRTLPWERNPDPEEEGKPTTKPWLALVVVAEGEAELSVTKPVAECVTPGTKLYEPTDKDVEQGLYLAVTETVLKKIFPCEEDLELLVHVREVDINDTELANGDDDGWLAVVLANRLPVFDKANGKPVRYMACLVNIEGQLKTLPAPEEPIDHFIFELAQDWTVLAAIDSKPGPDPRVMGGINLGDITLPSAGGLLDARPSDALAAGPAASRAYVSATLGAGLDGSSTMKEASTAQTWKSATEKTAAAARDPDAKRLVRDTMASGFRHPIEKFAKEKTYRFPVLAHWSFTTNEGVTFGTLMRGLDVGLLGTLPVPKEGAPPTPAGPEVVETGHIGLDHRTRRGDPVRAWYRGPLVPFPTERDPVDQSRPALAHSADQIRRAVPDGREDLSLAAAFEIGRLLGLSQLSVVSALLRFRREQFGAGRVREILSRVTPFNIPEIVDLRTDLGRFVALQMIGTLAENPEVMIGPRRPVADPGRALKFTGDLNTVIASGLGFDLAAVQKMSEQVGILAAISQAQVPLANPKGQVPLTKASVTNLRGALSTELNKVLDVAKPPIVIGTQRTSRQGKRAASSPGPTNDALDELIARAESLNAEDEE